MYLTLFVICALTQAENTMTTVFWDVTPCSLAHRYQPFRETGCYHLQGRRISCMDKTVILRTGTGRKLIGSVNWISSSGLKKGCIYVITRAREFHTLWTNPTDSLSLILALPSLYPILPWWWRQQVPLKHWYICTRPHGTTFYKRVIFTDIAM
jgi:hypothetical protein